MPRWRSDNRRMPAASSASGARVASTTTKSLPAPCILVNFSFTLASCGKGSGHDIVVHEKAVDDVHFQCSRDRKSGAQVGRDRSMVVLVDLQIKRVHVLEAGCLC